MYLPLPYANHFLEFWVKSYEEHLVDGSHLQNTLQEMRTKSPGQEQGFLEQNLVFIQCQV